MYEIVFFLINTGKIHTSTFTPVKFNWILEILKKKLASVSFFHDIAVVWKSKGADLKKIMFQEFRMFWIVLKSFSYWEEKHLINY
jgi:hypothetical protein